MHNRVDIARRDKPGQRAAPPDEHEIARRKELEHRKLQRMIEHAETASCLRATILQYFGETGAAERCTSCGNCRPDALDAYEHDMVRKILAGIARAGERYGRSRVANMLLGSPDESATALGRQKTSIERWR